MYNHTIYNVIMVLILRIRVCGCTLHLNALFQEIPFKATHTRRVLSFAHPCIQESFVSSKKII
jgi:hypothetical protein